MNPERTKAMQNEEITFIRIKPCANCDSHKFYTKSYNCIQCCKKRYYENNRGIEKNRFKKAISDENRQIAIKDNLNHYIRITPCSTCNEHKFYIKGGVCLKCQKDYYQKNKDWLFAAPTGELTKRDNAIKENKTYYKAISPCKKCNATDRFAVSDKCAICPRIKKMKIELLSITIAPRTFSGKLLKEAQKLDFSAYVSAIPCKHCYGHVRYVTTRCCIVCAKRNTKLRTKERIQHRNALNSHIDSSYKTMSDIARATNDKLSTVIA